MLRLLRPPLAASFLRSFRLHSPRYARETIAKNMLARVALVDGEHDSDRLLSRYPFTDCQLRPSPGKSTPGLLRTRDIRR